MTHYETRCDHCGAIVATCCKQHGPNFHVMYTHVHLPMGCKSCITEKEQEMNNKANLDSAIVNDIVSRYQQIKSRFKNYDTLIAKLEQQQTIYYMVSDGVKEGTMIVVPETSYTLSYFIFHTIEDAERIGAELGKPTLKINVPAPKGGM